MNYQFTNSDKKTNDEYLLIIGYKVTGDLTAS